MLLRSFPGRIGFFHRGKPCFLCLHFTLFIKCHPHSGFRLLCTCLELVKIQCSLCDNSLITGLPGVSYILKVSLYLQSSSLFQAEGKYVLMDFKCKHSFFINGQKHLLYQQLNLKAQFYVNFSQWGFLFFRLIFFFFRLISALGGLSLTAYITSL